MDLSESQHTWLARLNEEGGVGLLPSIVFTHLRNKGLVVTTGEGSGKRGYVACRITGAGIEALG